MKITIDSVNNGFILKVITDTFLESDTYVFQEYAGVLDQLLKLTPTMVCEEPYKHETGPRVVPETKEERVAQYDKMCGEAYVAINAVKGSKFDEKLAEMVQAEVEKPGPLEKTVSVVDEMVPRVPIFGDLLRTDKFKHKAKDNFVFYDTEFCPELTAIVDKRSANELLNLTPLLIDDYDRQLVNAQTMWSER